MKIAVFENEYESVRGAFEASNLLDFNGELDIKVFPSSQQANLNSITNYEVIFVDIDLSAKSELDGFTLIQKIQAIDLNFNDRIIILTGNNKINEALKLRNIEANSIQIIIKPTNYEEITKAINCVLDTCS